MASSAVAIRGDRRATIGTGVPGTGDALWVEAEPIVEPEPPQAVNELAREYRAVREHPHTRGARRMAAQLREITDPSRLADVSGYSPDLSLSQKVEVLETLDVEERLRLVLGWARECLADLALRETGSRATSKRASRRHSASSCSDASSRRSQGVERPRGRPPKKARSPRTTVPRSRSATCPKRSAPQSCASSTSSSTRTNRVPRQGWIRTWLDTVFEVPWGRVRRPPRYRPRRRGSSTPITTGCGRQGADPGAPGRAQTPGRARSLP